VEFPKIGTEFAGYQIEGVLGRGGMSVVFRALNLNLGNTVALKFMNLELAEDDRFRERFVRESRTAASLSHPNIIPIYAAGDWEGLLYIAMRYVAGKDLKALIRARAPLPLPRTVSIIGQVGGALDAAHSKGLIHRDIKPGNVLMESRSAGDADHVYLSDFGVTKHKLSRSGLTSTGHFVGTVAYVSPEQARGEGVDHRSDIYSLGCVIYECLTGVVPFDKDEDYAMLLAHVQEEPRPVSTLRRDLPPDLDALVARALAKDPEDRYQSCRELVADLRSAAGIETTAGGWIAPVSGGETVFAGEEPPRMTAEEAPAPRPETVVSSGDRGPTGGGQASGGGGQAQAPPLSRPARRPWLTPLLVALAAVAAGAAIASAAFLATGGGGNGGSTAGPPVGTSSPTAFPALQKVMNPTYYKDGRCSSTTKPLPGFPTDISNAADELIECHNPNFAGVPYDVFLYDDTGTVKAAFDTVLKAWHLSKTSDPNACKSGGGGVWTGHATNWIHATSGKLAGERACRYDQGHSRSLMVWTHERSNPTPQPDHYDVLVMASEDSQFPKKLQSFWGFASKVSPIGLSITGLPIPHPPR
jgi:hypothetical protein